MNSRKPDCGCLAGGRSGGRRSASRSRGRANGLKLLRLERSHKALKKYDAVFQMPNGRIKRVAFGAYHASGPDAGRPYEDFTMHHDEARRQRYIQRHSRRESFQDPTKPAALARYILWEKPTVSASLAAYRRRFGV